MTTLVFSKHPYTSLVLILYHRSPRNINDFTPAVKYTESTSTVYLLYTVLNILNPYFLVSTSLFCCVFHSVLFAVLYAYNISLCAFQLRVFHSRTRLHVRFQNHNTSFYINIIIFFPCSFPTSPLSFDYRLY